jgi:hypothetical protein
MDSDVTGSANPGPEEGEPRSGERGSEDPGPGGRPPGVGSSNPGPAEGDDRAGERARPGSENPGPEED